MPWMKDRMPDSDAILAEEDRRGPWGNDLLEAIREARGRAEERLGLTLDAPPVVRSIAPESAFYAELGRLPHHLVAVAQSGENFILINRPVFLSMDRSERIGTLVHELTHLILGRRVPGSLPRWLGEGMAMVTANERSWTYHTRIAVAASFGGLVPLGELWGGEWFGAADQELAYAQSLSATRFLLRSGLKGGLAQGSLDPGPLARKLADPIAGRALRELLADPTHLRGFEREWRASLRSLSTWFAALSGGGVFWFAATGLFLFAYYRKKKAARRMEVKWKEDEEAFPWLE